MNTKNIVKRIDSKGKGFYNYATTAFNNVGTNPDGTLKNARSNIYDLNLRIIEEVIPELNFYIRRGYKEFEIRKNEIYLRDAHLQHVSSVMSGLSQSYFDENNLVSYQNDEWFNNEINKLDEYCSEEFFKKFTTDLFTHNLKSSDELCIKYIHDGDNYPDGKLLIQIVKSFKSSYRKNVYLHKMKPKQLKQFRKLVK